MVRGRTHSLAFTLIEVLIVVVIIGATASMVLPRIFKKRPEDRWETVTDEINNLVYFARQEAISDQTTYRIHFQADKKGGYSARVEIELDDPEKPDKKIYKQAESAYFKPIYKFPETISIEAIYQNREEQMLANKQNAYCHVIPNGLVQETTIHLLRKEEDGAKIIESKVTLEMSPFFGKFELLEGFVKQEQ